MYRRCRCAGRCGSGVCGARWSVGVDRVPSSWRPAAWPITTVLTVTSPLTSTRRSRKVPWPWPSAGKVTSRALDPSELEPVALTTGGVVKSGSFSYFRWALSPVWPCWPSPSYPSSKDNVNIFFFSHYFISKISFSFLKKFGFQFFLTLNKWCQSRCRIIAIIRRIIISWRFRYGVDGARWNNERCVGSVRHLLRTDWCGINESIEFFYPWISCVIQTFSSIAAVWPSNTVIIIALVNNVITWWITLKFKVTEWTWAVFELFHWVVFDGLRCGLLID